MQVGLYAKNNTLLENISAERSFSVPETMIRNSGGILCFRTLVPVREITSLWHPALAVMPPVRLPWKEIFSCGASKSFPLLVFLDQKANRTCALGLTDMIDDCEVSVKMNQKSCIFEVEFRLTTAPETEEFIFFLETADSSCQSTLAETLAKYRSIVLPELPQYPAGAWKSVYCSWYAVHAALTDEYMQNNVEEAAHLGFGTFIVDDGWCFEEAKRVTPETLPDWYRDIGDWQYSEKKLPLLKETIRKARQKGLSCLFWVSPFFAGRRSKLNENIRKYLTELNEGYRVYDVAERSVTEKVMESIYNIYKKLDLDGLKIDFVDIVQPDTEKPRCRLVYSSIKDLVEKMKKHKKDALIEFRQNYATPLMAPLATAFRAGDVPFDYMNNFARCIQIRLLMGDKIPVHADPVYFNSDESAESAGRHLIASLAGVPMVSMELTQIREEHKKVIANYLSFYKEKQSVLNGGHWEFDFCNNFASSLSCTLGEEKIVILSDSNAFERSVKKFTGKITVLNMTPDPISVPDGEIFDAQGKNCCGGLLPSGGRFTMNVQA